MFTEPELFGSKSEERVDTRKFLLVGRTTCREERLRLGDVHVLSTSVKKDWVLVVEKLTTRE